MLQLSLVHLIQRLAIPVCCLCAWTLIALFCWNLWVAARDGVRRLRQLHQVPCNRCAFFTGDYRLKCTVHPLTALSNEAIDCPDH